MIETKLKLIKNLTERGMVKILTMVFCLERRQFFFQV